MKPDPHLPKRANPGQVLAIQAEAPYLLVSAGAGTGKTWTLVHRIMRLLRAGCRLDKLAAITFTKKAAAELLTRVAEELSRNDALEAERFLLPQAYISTIDSFCQRLLREHAVTCGVDPGFGILSSPDDQLVQTEILDELFHSWYRGRPAGPEGAEACWTGIPAQGSAEHHEFLRLVEQCGFQQGRERLRDELAALHRMARARGKPDQWVDELEEGLGKERPPHLGFAADLLLGRYRECARRYGEVISLGESIAPDANYGKMKDALSGLQSAPSPWGGPPVTGWPEGADLIGGLETLQAHLGTHELLKEGKPWAFKFPTVARGSGETIRIANAAAKTLLTGKSGNLWTRLPHDLNDLRTEYRTLAPTLGTVIGLLRQFMVRYEAHKEKRGLLDFADLEIKALDLLKQSGPAIREQFHMLLVDEAQDLNRLQADIVDQLTPERGRYLVGDVKQCIYQFRLSNPRIFMGLFENAAELTSVEDLEASKGEERQRVFLAENFRSGKPILEFTNFIFRNLFDERTIGSSYEQQALKAPEPHTETKTASKVEVHILAPKSARSVTGHARLEAEVRLVAERIHALEAEGIEIPDGDSGKMRPLCRSDIAIILRSPGSKGLPVAQVLRSEGIAVAFGGKDLFEREEIRDLLNLLRLLNNSFDDITLAAVMRSPAGGFADDDLVRLRLLWPDSIHLCSALEATVRGTPDDWSGEPANLTMLDSSVGQDLQSRARGFWERLERWRTAIGRDDLPGTIVGILEESGFLTTQLAAEDHNLRLANLELLLGRIRGFARDHGHSLPKLIAHLENLDLAKDDTRSFQEGGAQEDAVQLLSLHAAKGLEFPVVVLALLGSDFTEIDLRSALLSGDRWLGANRFDPVEYLKTPTVVYETLKTVKQHRSRQEEMRVLYVALTRAKYRLILTGCSHSTWKKLPEKLALWGLAGPLSSLDLLRISRPLDWILGTLHRTGLLKRIEDPGTEHALLANTTLFHHSLDELAAKPQTAISDPAVREIQAIFDGTLLDDPAAARARLEEAFADRAGQDQAASASMLEACQRALPAVARRVTSRYAHEEATDWRSKYWVTEIKRLISEGLAEEERLGGTELLTRGPAGDGRREGTYLHAVLAAVDPAATEMEEILRTAQTLAAEGDLPPDWASADTLAPILAFLQSDLAASMRASADLLEREVNFSMRLSPADLAPLWQETAGLPPEEWFLVQGQIDAVWQTGPGQSVLLDFKSDQVETEDQIQARAEQYKTQMQLYRLALIHVWNVSDPEGWLYFLRPGRAIKVF